MSIDLKVFTQKLFRAAEEAGFLEYEVYYVSGTTETYRVFDGEIAEFKRAGADGLSFRGLYEGKMGYAFTERIADDVIPFLIENAKQNAQIIESADAEVLYAGDEEYPTVSGYNEALDNVSSAEMAEAALAMEKAAFAADARVTGLSYCVLNRGDGSLYIANSKGLDLSHESNYLLAYLMPNVEANGTVQTGLDGYIGNKWEDFDAAALAKAAVARAVSKLGAVAVKSGAYDVVLHREAMKDLLETFSGVFSAESVQKGFSLLKDKLHTKIASEAITIRDDALLPDELGSVPFDSEGVASRNKAVVENGVLQTYLHNLKTAAKDGVASTGNGFKSSYQSSVGIQPTNFYIAPSDISYETLLNRMGDGLLITELEGLHSGANEISGDFSLSAKGYKVQNGQAASAVEQITIAGNFFALLKDIEVVGSDLCFRMPGDGNIGAPSVLVRGMSVSGE